MPYLSAADYIARFGEAETQRLTDETKTGTVDEAKVASEIAGAEATVEAYLVARYALPLNPVPSIIVDLVGDLARERLHRTRPLEAVTAAGDRARKFLADLAKGAAVLPSATAPSETPVDGLPVTSADAEPTVFGPCSQARYTEGLAPSLGW